MNTPGSTPLIRKLMRQILFGYSAMPSTESTLSQKRRSGLTACFEEGFYSQIWITLTAGKFLTDLVLHWGAQSFALGLINAIPFLVAPAQILGAILVSRLGSRRRVLLPGAGVSRLCWWGVLLLLLLPLPNATRLTLFIVLFVVIHVSGQIAGIAWISWLSDLIPERIRGRVVATRNGMLIFVALGADFIFSRFREYAGEPRRDLYLGLMLFVACLFGVKSLMAFSRQWEPPFSTEPTPPMGSILRKFWREPGLKRLTLALVVWNLAVGVAIAFWAPHMILYLKISFIRIFFYTLIIAFFNFFMSRFIWGKVIDQAGTVPVVMFCALLISCIPLFWLLIVPGNLFMFWMEAILNGIAWSGFNVAVFTLPFAIVPIRNRAHFFAVLSAISGLALGLGAVAGGIIAQSLEHMRIEILGVTYINYHVTFILSSILRLSSAFLFSGIPDSRNRGIYFMLKSAGDGLVRLRTNPRLIFAFRKKPNKKRGTKALEGASSRAEIQIT